MNSEKVYNPIVISKDFCWERNSAGRVERDFWGNATNFGFSSTVLCSSWNASDEVDVLSGINYEKSHIKVVKIKEIWCTRALQSILNRFPIPDFRYLPDTTYLTWGNFVKRRIEELIKSNNYDYIDSIGMPHGSHLLALKIKEKYNLPWVARFYDPWTDNQHRAYRFTYFREKDKEIEKNVAEKADVIIHNNYHIARLWEERYGEHISKKIRVIPMIFDSSRLNNYLPQLHQKGQLVISHIGNLFGVRNAQTFISAIDLLINKYPALREHLKINMIGWVPEKDIEEITKLQLNDIFYLTGRIPEKECTDYFNKTDLFISIDGKGELDLNYPSKLLKYFYYRRPILGLTLDNSVAAEELDRSGNRHVRLDDVNAIANEIEYAFNNYESMLDFDYDYYNRFSPERIICTYRELVNELMNGGLTV